MSLSISDEADFELLKRIDETPKSRTDELAEDLDTDKRSVASRLAWMMRMDLVERTLAMGWVLTPKGKDLITEQAANLMQIRELSKQAKRSRSRAWVTRREFKRNLG